MMDNFLNTMNSRFEDIKENGKSIYLNIGFKEGSEKDMDIAIDAEGSLSEKVEAWIEKNAYKGSYNIQGVTKTKMIINEIRIPVKNEDGTNYKTSNFVALFRKFLASINVNTERDIQGNRIFISVL